MRIHLSSQEQQNACHDTPRKERLFFNAFHFIKSSPKSFFEPKSGRLTRIMLMLQKMNLAPFGRTSLTGLTEFTGFSFILLILLILSKKWKFLYYELEMPRLTIDIVIKTFRADYKLVQLFILVHGLPGHPNIWISPRSRIFPTS